MHTGSNQINTVGAHADVKRAPIMIALIIGAFFAILNETLLNVALTQLMVEFQVGEATVQWLSTGFMLMVGILIPVSALLISWFTTRQMFIGAMTLFTIGTLISGLAPNFSVLLIGRLIQASGTGLLLPIMMNTILVLFPPEKRGGAMGMMGLVIMFAPALGPTLSGVIIEALNWRWLFFSVVPFALFSILFAFIFLKNVTKVTKPKVDVISIILSTLGFGGIVFGFSSAGEGASGWTHPEVYGTIILGALSLILFVLRQLKMEEPILDVRTFRSPMFSITTILLIIVMMSMFSTMILIPMFLQGAMALTAFAAGLALLPGGLLNGLMSPIMGKLFDKFGPTFLVRPGAILLVVVLILFTTIHTETPIYVFVVYHCLLMVAIAMMMMPAQTNALNELPPKYYPHGTAILNTLQQVAGAIGVALFISIMSNSRTNYLSENVQGEPSVQDFALSLTAGVQTSFKVGLCFAIVALVLTFFIKRVKEPKDI
ncbi:DHA2 family efflux MFS transporter permease subunit [Alkalihalobacillus pseudalcaliphilus]|uniref:DHA2 family efflux MFS transporter permease subunit n=1 Tax=Alkalihalobacillus pseudalcaliphilus TaxID=79884 RepID=UPI00064DF811|nr:DHA2 family efflux MFS transporter permease subunit [Alkalihalobacillus pseudalcaliphilus]KMK76909.1 multidrug MFS transporter [Alkalihalobacillus pseudalcaliphilus]